MATTKNSTAPATVEGKLKKLVNAKVLLLAVFFTDVLAEAKRFSLITQEKNNNVIKMLNAVETTKSNYKRLLKRIKENSEYMFNLPNLKIMIHTVKPNKDDDGIPRYLGHKLIHYSQEVCHLLDRAACFVERIIS